MNWIEVYSNTKNLFYINQSDFKRIKDFLFDLDVKYMLEDEWYVQQLYEWYLQLGVLLEKMVVKGENKNTL